MLTFLAENIGTIVISLALAGIVALIIISMVKGKKKGKGSCSCGCSACAMQGKCHKCN